MRRADHELVEISVRIDRDESDQPLRLLGYDDGRLRHQLVAPALAPAIDPLCEIDGGIGELPGALPERDRGVLVRRLVGSEDKWRRRQRETVMPGLVPGIHVFLAGRTEGVGGRA